MSSLETAFGTPRRRRKLSAEKKYAILEEIRAFPNKKGEILRREGLYRSDIIRFEQVARDGAIKELKRSKPGRKRDEMVSLEEYDRLKNELKQKEKALAELSVEYMVLKKKENGA